MQGKRNGGGQLRDRVRAAYSFAAEQPGGRHPFPVGRAFVESLGYPSRLLDQIPAVAVEAFAGVCNVPAFADVPQRGTVLDVGCGAGLDTLVVARRMAATGKVVGIDFSRAMLERARDAAAESGAANVLFCQADAERLPLNDGTIDAALVNGIFNLNPARNAIFAELARCLRAGGCVYAAEIILREPLAPETKASESDWFA